MSLSIYNFTLPRSHWPITFMWLSHGGDESTEEGGSVGAMPICNHSNYHSGYPAHFLWLYPITAWLSWLSLHSAPVCRTAMYSCITVVTTCLLIGITRYLICVNVPDLPLLHQPVSQASFPGSHVTFALTSLMLHNQPSISHCDCGPSLDSLQSGTLSGCWLVINVCDFVRVYKARGLNDSVSSY